MSGLSGVSTNSPVLVPDPTDDHHESVYSEWKSPTTSDDKGIGITRSIGSNGGGKKKPTSDDDSDDDDSDDDDSDDDGSEAGSMSSGVSLGAEIIPAVGIVVTPGTINFGFLGAGEVSEVRTVLINNRGADDTIITADVMDAADDLFIDGLYVDTCMWDEYSTLLGSKEMTTADLTLHVPSDYSNIGSMKGILVVWAEIE
ncbi:hypothetical protein [Methanococcoides sp. NM1]|uniref:hypothetical protein n=1 Tax=Methanococcoides sp. NM1 TaxID=1201013 RepID=UPI0014386489|nr:hypothetical protein [Methanococcoides sp. NM1]